MIYEVRNLYLAPGGAVAEFEERFAKRLPLREKHSKLGAFWHTEVRSAQSIIHVYPTTTLTSARPSAPRWPKTRHGSSSRWGDLIVAQEAEIMNPAPLCTPWAAGTTAPGM